MKILVPETAEFIGSYSAIKLINRGDEVFGLDNLNDYYDKNLKYGRFQRDGIINTLENGLNIHSSKLLTSSFNLNYQLIKLKTDSNVVFDIKPILKNCEGDL